MLAAWFEGGAAAARKPGPRGPRGPRGRGRRGEAVEQKKRGGGGGGRGARRAPETLGGRGRGQRRGRVVDLPHSTSTVQYIQYEYTQPTALYTL